MDTLWIRCVINQSDPLRFVSSSRSSRTNVEFLTESIENLTLPMNFFAQDDHDRRSWDSILFDTTQLSQIEQLEIFNGTFSGVLSTKINIVVSDCGKPMVEIRGRPFPRYIAKHLRVILQNLSRTVLLEDFVSDQCLMDDEIVFDRRDETTLTILFDLNYLHTAQAFGSTKWWVNGIFLGTTLGLTCLLACLTVRRDKKAHVRDEKLKTQDAASTVMSTSELSFSQRSGVL